METREASKPPTPAEGLKVNVVEAMTDLYTRSIERLAEFQKKGLEVAVRQNAEVVTTWKSFAFAAPAVALLDLGNTAFERFAETQKVAVDLMVEQTHTLAKLVKERNAQAVDTIEENKGRVREAIEHSVSAHKTALDYTAKQAKAAFATAKQQLGYAGTPVGAAADSMERGMDIVVDAQKELLDLVAAPAAR